MLMVEYRMLREAELTPELLNHFQRRQEVTHCWRKIDGRWEIKPIAFVDDWSAQDREFVVWCFGNILRSGGMVTGAFADGCLKGVICVENRPMGSRGQYRELSGFWVSREMRGQGIGKRLFAMAKAFAKEQGGRKLYISSHPSVESQSFYRAMGCVEAEEYSAPHVEREPDACQIECPV